MLSRLAWDEAELAIFVQTLEDRVDGGQVVRVPRNVEADPTQTIADLDGRQRNAASHHKASGIGEPHRHGRDVAEQRVQRADGLRQLREAIVDRAPLQSEILVFLDGRGERCPVVIVRHTLTYTYCVNQCQRWNAYESFTNSWRLSGARSCWSVSSRLSPYPTNIT